MGRKKRKQQRKLKHQQKAETSWTNKLARELSTYIASLPPREHRGDSFISDNGSGCVPFGQMFGYAYCKSCWAKTFCQNRLNPKWRLENNELAPLR